MRAVERWITYFTHPVVMLVYLVLMIGCYVLIDQPLAWKFHSLHLEEEYPVLVWVTQLGRSVVWLVILPFMALFFRFGHRVKQTEARLWFLWGTLFFANGCTYVLKNLLGRARPELLFSEHVFGFFGYQADSLYHSFPSGHATQVTASVLSLALLYPRQRWIFLVLGTLVMASRVLLTKHYLSDVLTTLCLVVLEYKVLLYIVAQQCPLYWKRLGVK